MWSNPQFPADLVTFPEVIFNGKSYFLCSGDSYKKLFYPLPFIKHPGQRRPMNDLEVYKLQKSNQY